MNRFKGIAAIIKKEFTRFFLDRRMLLTTILLPGLLIYVVYTLMGSLVTGLVGSSSYTAAVRNMPDMLAAIFSESGYFEIDEATEDDEYYKSQITEGSLDIYVIFPEDFDSIIFGAGSEGYVAPTVEIYYSSLNDGSSAAFSAFVSVLDAFEDEFLNVFNVSYGDEYDLSAEASGTNYILKAIVPMVLLVMLFSGCMSVAPESIAGEKERGLFATMLVTPVKRSHIAVGKIVSLSCISLLGGIASFLGLILSLPNLLQGALDGFDLSMFNVGHYAMLLGVMLSTVLLLVALISCISALAKSVKEAGSYVGPLNIVVVVVGLLSSFVGGNSWYLYLIPVYSSAMLVTDIMALAVSPLNFIITLISNILYAALLVFLLTRMFKSERIMFNK